MVGRDLREEWGIDGEGNDELVTCVARFGRSREKEEADRAPHVTGARMARSNGHEVRIYIQVTWSKVSSQSLNVVLCSGITMYVYSCLHC